MTCNYFIISEFLQFRSCCFSNRKNLQIIQTVELRKTTNSTRTEENHSLIFLIDFRKQQFGLINKDFLVRNILQRQFLIQNIQCQIATKMQKLLIHRIFCDKLRQFARILTKFESPKIMFPQFLFSLRTNGVDLI